MSDKDYEKMILFIFKKNQINLYLEEDKTEFLKFFEKGLFDPNNALPDPGKKGIS